MKSTHQKEELLKAVSLVSRLATTRATLPILQNIYIEAGKRLVLRATDLEQTIEVEVEGMVSETGSITVPARLLQEYLQNNSDDEVTLKAEDINLQISSSNHTARIKGLAAEEYPSMPQVKSPIEITINSTILKEAISKTLFAAANDDQTDDVHFPSHDFLYRSQLASRTSPLLGSHYLVLIIATNVCC